MKLQHVGIDRRDDRREDIVPRVDREGNDRGPAPGHRGEGHGVLDGDVARAFRIEDEPHAIGPSVQRRRKGLDRRKTADLDQGLHAAVPCAFLRSPAVFKVRTGQEISADVRAARSFGRACLSAIFAHKKRPGIALEAMPGEVVRSPATPSLRTRRGSAMPPRTGSSVDLCVTSGRRDGSVQPLKGGHHDRRPGESGSPTPPTLCRATRFPTRPKRRSHPNSHLLSRSGSRNRVPT